MGQKRMAAEIDIISAQLLKPLRAPLDVATFRFDTTENESMLKI